MYLHPEKRRKFIDVIAAPPSYRVAATIGTTYSVDLSVLGIALLTLAGVPWADDELVKKITPKDVLKAIAGMRDKLLVFFDQGRVHDDLPGGHPGVTNLLDTFLLPHVFRAAAFHPKVWIIKYSAATASRAPDMYRLLVARLSRLRKGTGSESFKAKLQRSSSNGSQRETEPGDSCSPTRWASARPSSRGR